MKKERWAFSAGELDTPQGLMSTDELVATLPSPYHEVAVLVQRNGEVTNRYEDGTAGLSDEIRELAGECESLYHPNDDEVTAEWRQVYVTDEGVFIGFVPDAET